MTEKVGISVLKKDVVIIAKVIGTTDKALEDGKVNLIEGFSIAKDSIALIEVARRWREAREEIKDLSSAERVELHAHVERELDLRNDQAEKQAEAAIGVILSLTSALKVRNEAA